MKCPNCGQENRDSAIFCQKCGHRLGPVDAPQDSDQPAEIETSAAEDAAAEPEPESTETPQIEAEGTPTTEEPALPDGEATASDPLQADAEGEVEAEPPEEVVLKEDVEDVDVKETDIEEVAEGADIEGAYIEMEKETEASIVPEADEEEAGEDTGADTKDADAKDADAEESPPVVDAMAETLYPVAEAEPDAEQAAQVEPSLDEEIIGEPLEETEEQEALVPLETEPEGDAFEAEMQELTDADLLPWRDEVESLEALAEGTVVQDRYRVAEVLAIEDQEILYRVRDLKRCPQCGSDDNSPDEFYCVSCGAMLEEKPLATMIERPVERLDEPVEAEVESKFVEGDRAYWVWREIVKPEGQMPAQPPMNMVVGQKSDTGMVRELDEDGLFVLTMARTLESVQDTLALFVVADGMGGHEGGEVASQIAIQAVANTLLHNVFVPELGGTKLSLDEIQDWMCRAGQVANDQVYLERQKRQNDMGTTLTAALIKDWTMYLAHIGDCRAYRWGENGLEQLTTDHSVVASMVAAGTASPDEIYTHPQRSVIYRCVGDQPSVEVDTSVLPVDPGDRLVLCCDGLWEMLRTEGIEDILLRESDPQQACEVMVEQANIAGGADNISVIVIQL